MQFKAFFLFYLLCINSKTNAQDNVKPLKIGDQIPEVGFFNIINFPEGKIKLSDFKGKLIILDFWNKACASCIKSFPKMQELQDKFKDKIQILLVTSDSPLELKNLFSSSPIVRNIKLPFILGDTILNKIFPHVGVPHHVWIDPKGVLLASTDSYYANRHIITNILAGKKIDFRKKVNYVYQGGDLLEEGQGRFLKFLKYYSSILDDSNESKVLIQNEDNYINKSKYYSAIMSRLDIGKNGYGIGQSEIFILNRAVSDIYRIAYQMPLRSKVIFPINYEHFKPINVSDPDPFWYDKNLYCYQLKLPLFKSASMFKLMQLDLARFFGLVGTIERQLTPCIILYKISSLDRLKSKEGNYVFEDTKSKEGIIIKNAYFGDLINYMRSFYKSDNDPVIINEIDYADKVDLIIKSDLRNIDNLRNELEKYGIGIRQELMPINVLLLKEN